MGEQVAARSNGDVAQLGEHLPCKQGVDSSNLFISTSCAGVIRGGSNPERESGGRGKDRQSERGREGKSQRQTPGGRQ